MRSPDRGRRGAASREGAGVDSATMPHHRLARRLQAPRSPRTRSPRTRWGWLGRGLVAVAAVWFVFGGVGAEGPVVRYDDPAAGRARLDELMGLVVDLRATLDRSAFDLDALALELAFEDEDGLVAWMEREIAFEPYAGLLRGPQGTLLARAGNALDQAVLLARLLNDVGLEARVALARLDEAGADGLLRQALRPRPAPPAIGDRAAMEAVVVRLAELLGRPSDELMLDLELTFAPPPVTDAGLVAEVVRSGDGLGDALRRGGVVLGGDAAERLREEARDYAWTEARWGPGEPWIALHPTGFVPPLGLVAETHLDGEVPEALQHRIRIEAWVERKEGERLVVESLMDPWERPIANVIGVVLDYANAPNGFATGPIGGFGIDDVLAATNFFSPSFLGRLAPGGRFFDLDGRTVAPDLAGEAAAALFQTVASGVERAASLLGGLGGQGPSEDPDDLIALVGHGLDVTLIAPGGEETSYRRWVLDRLGAAHRAAGEVVVDDGGIDVGRTLLRQHRMVVTAGALPQGYLLDRTLAGLLEGRDLYGFVLDQLARSDPDAVLDDDALGAESPVDHLLLADLFDRRLAALGDAPGYRSGPAVVILGRALQPDDTLLHSVDIVVNPRRVLVDGGDGTPVLDPAAVLRRGVWETIAEREALRDEDADRQVAAADAQGPFVLLRPGDEVDAVRFGVDAEAMRSLEADLARGHLVLLPVAPPPSGGGAWWRVDPITGTTLGITADGRGQTMTEYTIQLYDNAFTVMFAVKGISDCIGLGGTAEACCLVKAHINNVTGLGFGSVIGKAFGGAAGLSFGLTSGVLGTDFAGGMGLSCEGL
jgi:hypothetical protein